MPTSLPERVFAKPEPVSILAVVAAALAITVLTCSMVLAAPVWFEPSLPSCSCLQNF